MTQHYFITYKAKKEYADDAVKHTRQFKQELRSAHERDEDICEHEGRRAGRMMMSHHQMPRR
jgi:hypothetical protein